MESRLTDSEEIHQYNIAITRCHEINGCVEEILYSIRTLQSKCTKPALHTGKLRIIQQHSKQHPAKKNHVEVEREILSRSRSLHLIARTAGDFIFKCIQIQREIEGSLKHLQFIRQKCDRKYRLSKTSERNGTSCNCLYRKLDRQREK